MDSLEADVPAQAPDRGDQPPAAVSAAAPGRGDDRRHDVFAALAAVVITLVALVPLLGLGGARLSVPFHYHGDASAVGMVIKSIDEHGWYLDNPSMNAPFGQQFHDIPIGTDNLQFLLLKLLSFLTNDFALIMNLYFLLTFPLVALAALFFLRSVGVSRPLAVVLSCLFALLPYHFAQGVDHLFLSGYFAVPLGTYLAMAVLRGQPLFSSGGERGLRRWVSPRSAGTLALCWVVASCGVYYAAFGLIMVGFAALIRAATERRPTALLVGAAVGAIIVLILFANQLPTFLFWRSHGKNAAGAVRYFWESEFYGLKLAQIVLPRPDHRLGWLGALSRPYFSGAPLPGEGNIWLGAVASFGVLRGLWLVLVGTVRRYDQRMADERDRNVAVLLAAAFLTATLGGLSAIFAALVSPQIRVWGRMSVMIGILGLAVAGLAFDRLWARVRGLPAFRESGLRTAVGVALLAGLFLGGALDQTSPGMVPSYAANRTEYETDRAFVADLERALPRAAMVYQLPARPYPESPPTQRLKDYEQLNLYLHSRALRWSAGGVKGRPESDWQAALELRPLEQVVPLLAFVGFSAIVVDGFGYPDNGVAVERTLETLVGEAPRPNAEGRMFWVPLGGYRERLERSVPVDRRRALAYRALHPVRLIFEEGFYDMETGGDSRWQWGRRRGVVVADNLGRRPAAVDFVTTVEMGVQEPAMLQVEYPDGTKEAVRVAGGGTRLSRRLVLPPGRNLIRFSTDAPRAPVDRSNDSRDLRFKLIDAQVVDVALSDLAREISRPAHGGSNS